MSCKGARVLTRIHYLAECNITNDIEDKKSFLTQGREKNVFFWTQLMPCHFNFSTYPTLSCSETGEREREEGGLDICQAKGLPLRV